MRRFLVSVSVLALLNLAGGACLPAAATERLIVSDLSGKGVSQTQAELLTDLLIESLFATGKYHVSTRVEVQTVVEALTDLKQIDAGCSTVKCLVAIGNAMGADRVLSGDVGVMGDTYVVTLSMYNTSTGAREARRTWECRCDENDLMAAVKSYGRELMGLPGGWDGPTRRTPLAARTSPPPAPAARSSRLAEMPAEEEAYDQEEKKSVFSTPWPYVGLGVAATAVIAVVALGGGDDGPNIVGRWQWDGQNYYIDFASGGTFTDTLGSTGRWDVSGNTITFTFANGVSYNGTVSGNTMSVYSSQTGLTIPFTKVS